MKNVIKSLAMLPIILLAAWGTGRACQQPPPAWDWPVSTPDREGMDPQKLTDLADAIRKGEVCPRLHALLVVRHGRLGGEE